MLCSVQKDDESNPISFELILNRLTDHNEFGTMPKRYTDSGTVNKLI